MNTRYPLKRGLFPGSCKGFYYREIDSHYHVRAWEIGKDLLLFTMGKNRGERLLVSRHGSDYPWGRPDGMTKPDDGLHTLMVQSRTDGHEVHAASDNETEEEGFPSSGSRTSGQVMNDSLGKYQEGKSEESYRKIAEAMIHGRGHPKSSQARSSA